ncbi:MAG: ferrous iron transport protein B [Pseudomonadota bacterium]|nr:ferrous iron transport protein B [Pseudomonadota bacterium]
MSKQKVVGLVGNPNVGKTLLFNRLTACQNCVGNWAGVTATCRRAKSNGLQHDLMYIDLPGCYHLPDDQAEKSQTESMASIGEILNNQSVDIWVNVIDVKHLSRGLYLTIQLLERYQDVVVVLNQVDAIQGQAEIDASKLSKILGCEVLTVSAKFSMGLLGLKAYLSSAEKKTYGGYTVLRYPEPLERIIQTQHDRGDKTRYSALKSCIRMSQQDSVPSFLLTDGFTAMLKGYQFGLSQFIAQARHEKANQIFHACFRKVTAEDKQRKVDLDRWFLNKWLGLPLFFIMMFGVFWFSMSLGQYAQEVLDPLWQFVFIDCIGWAIANWHGPEWMLVLLTQGLGVGIVTALSFFPILICMFISLHYLEESGYMARAAVIMDRMMRTLGLPGESFVALILGFGCNVPGILATKHIKKQQDKVATALMMPFMSCSARLTIFAVFSAAFFAKDAAVILFFLYTIGIIVACITGLLVKVFYKNKERENTTYLLELPCYQMPKLQQALTQGLRRSSRFVRKAIKPIILVCTVLAWLNHMHMNGVFVSKADHATVLAVVSKQLAWFFYPIGVHTSQWPLIVALITGLFAKEVVISTLGVFYASSLQHDVLWYHSQTLAGLWGDAQQAILNSMMHWSLLLPIGEPEAAYTWLSSGLGFASKDHIIAYLIFLLLYFPCISTLFAIEKQAGWYWAIIALFWSTFMAYAVAGTYLGVSMYMPWMKWLLPTILTSVLKCILVVWGCKKAYHRYEQYQKDNPPVHEAFK